MDKLNFGQFLESVAKRVPNKTAIIYRDRTYTYREFIARVHRLAAVLRSNGVGHRDRVGILCHNSSEYLEVVFACVMIGAVCVQYNWRLSPGEVRNLINRSGPRLIFFSAHFAECYTAIYPLCSEKITWISVDGILQNAKRYETLMEGGAPAQMCWEGGGEDIALQIYTSGTTGAPKGVMLSHRAVITHALCNIIDCHWKNSDVFLCILPLFHASSSGTYNSLLSGATVVIHERFHEEAYLESINTYRVTRLSLTPTMLKSLLGSGKMKQYDLTSVQSIVYGAAPITETVLKNSLEYFHCDFYQLYGMTEMSPTVSVLQPEDHTTEGTPAERRHLCSVGRPGSGVMVKIVGSSGMECPAGTSGEILAFGDGMMSGYQGMPEKTAEALRDGWYHTGDIGRFDKDGYLYITGRLTDVIISGEENICASEVEDCIRCLDQDVQDVAVVGLPDERWGEIVAAAIVRCPDSKITEEEVIAHCRSAIASYKKPQRIVFVSELPRNSCGKVLKKELKLLF